ncbi:MAG: BrnT family toxin [Desulfuromonadaceae bacterium]
MKITWDSKKTVANPRNHEGVTFEEAQHVLLDPFALTREDSDSVDEQRFITLGMSGKGRILMVVYTYRDETIRLISAWKANEPQRRRYESQF